jgi:hypothetical protein
MSGIDQEIKDFVKVLEKQTSQNGVEPLNGEQKTADQDIPSDLPGIVNGPAGTAKWGIGKLHHVHSPIFSRLPSGFLKLSFMNLS